MSLLSFLPSRSKRRPPGMPSPVHQALLLPECLEMILQQLDPLTLLISAQLVCKRWHDIIAASRALQIKLFLAPPADDHIDGEVRTRNPLLVNAFPAFFHTGLHDKVPTKYVLKRLLSTRGPRLKHLLSPSARERHRQDPPLLRKGASWRRMFPEYPVTYKIGLIEGRGPGQLAFYSGVLDVREGVRAGKLFDVAYTMMLGRDWPDTTFGVYWREKEMDPKVTRSSGSYGMEEVALSNMEDDVRIVICPGVYSQTLPKRPASIKVLDERYRPAGFEFSPVEMGFSNSHDWFG